MAVELAVAGGVGDHGGVHAADGLVHVRDDLRLRLVDVQVQQRSHALRHRFGGHDDDLLLSHRDALLGGHDDVFVVGEDEDRGGRGAVDLPEDVLRGGVHGLAAGDDAVGAEVAEQILHALAGADGNDAVLLFRFGEFRLGGAFFQLLLDFFQIVGALRAQASELVERLQAHVFDLRQLQRAELHALGQRERGHVGVHVHLDDLVVVVDDQRVADAVQIEAQRLQIHVGIVLAHRIDRVEDVLLRHVHLVRHEYALGLGGGRSVLLGGADLAAQGGEHGVEDDHVALAARVDDAGLFQHGILVDGVLQRLVAGLQRALQRLLQALFGLGGFLRGGGGQAGNGEDGALGGLHDGLVGGLHAVDHGGGKFIGAGGLQILQPLGDAAEQQAEDDAGVAARAAQQRGGHAGGGLGDGVEISLFQLLGGAAEGQAHVGAGIAVRHGKDVQLVDGLHVTVKRRVGAQDHFLEGGGVDIISQVLLPPGISGAYPIIVSIYTSTFFTGTPVERCSL